MTRYFIPAARARCAHARASNFTGLKRAAYFSYCEAGTLALNRPDISTQVRFRKEEEIRKGEAALRASGAVAPGANIKMLTSCPSCLQGLTRYGNDLNTGLLEADYIVVEMANQILGADWLPQYVQTANAGGIERVLV